ncbi:hypothetical protein ACJZ2D_011793 [Fusarium nematophilum]
MANLASTFWRQGRRERAEELQIRVMRAMERTLGDENPDTLASIADLARMYGHQGRWDEAAVLQARVMETRERVLGAHPLTLLSMANMASIWKALQLQEKAEALLEDCCRLREQVLGPDHPDTKLSRSTLDEWRMSEMSRDYEITKSETFHSLSSKLRGLTNPSSLMDTIFARPDRVTESHPVIKKQEKDDCTTIGLFSDRKKPTEPPSLSGTAGELPHRKPGTPPAHVTTASSGILTPNSYALRTPNAGMARVYRKIWTFLSDIGLRDYDIEPGYRRVRWKNRRGKLLYDDYVEHEPGALQDLQAYLNSSAYRSGTGSSSGNSPESSIWTPSSPPGSSVQASNSESSDIADQHPKAPSNARISRFREDLELGELSATTLHLLSCMEQRRYAVVLHQELVTHITDDRNLFRTLRDSYHEHRGKLRGYCSLRTIHAIHFMKFAYGGRRYIDARCHNEICEQGKPCYCLPPVTLVRPRGSEYECSPVPSKFSPPIGPRLMMDFFTNPDDIGPDSTLVLRQIPKWTGGKLQPPHSEVVEAWGIYYKDGWDWAKIWWILGIGFFPPSLLFGVLWGILKQDVQGAFGVASWWMAGATIVVGIVGTSTWTT